MSSFLKQSEWIGAIEEIVRESINNPVFAEYGLIGLFVNGLFSTFIPFPPEVTAAALMLAGESSSSIVIVLSGGWIIGSALAYYAGASGSRLFKWIFPRKDRREEPKRSKWRGLLEKYGWSLVFISPWIPIAGDFIPAIAGVKKYNLCIFMVAISAGKIVKAVAVMLFGGILVPTF